MNDYDDDLWEPMDRSSIYDYPEEEDDDPYLYWSEENEGLYGDDFDDEEEPEEEWSFKELSKPAVSETPQAKTSEVNPVVEVYDDNGDFLPTEVLYDAHLPETMDAESTAEARKRIAEINNFIKIMKPFVDTENIQKFNEAMIKLVHGSYNAGLFEGQLDSNQTVSDAPLIAPPVNSKEDAIPGLGDFLHVPGATEALSDYYQYGAI